METKSPPLRLYRFQPPFLQHKLIIRSSHHSIRSCLALRIIAEPQLCDTGPSSLSCLKMVHAQIIKSADKSRPAENLIQQYVESGDTRSAAILILVGRPRLSGHLGLFAELKKDRALLLRILEVFSELHLKGIGFDRTTFVYVLIVCTCVSDLLLGLEIHTHLLKRGFIFYVDVQLALMRFYHRCWGIGRVNQLFDGMLEQHCHGLVWIEAIKMNLKSEKWMRVFQLFQYSMHTPLAKSVSTTSIIMLQACAKLKALKEGKQIHGYILRSGLELSVSVGNALINMYAKNEELQLAVEVFDLMEEINLTSWNSIISAHASLGSFSDAWDCFITLRCSDVQPDIITWNCLMSGLIKNGSYRAGLSIFHKMQLEGFHPNSSSVTCALQSVIELGLLNCGKEIHSYVIKHSLEDDVYVGTSLVDMYVKSDCLATAEKVLLFSNMKISNIFAWNALISGYSFKGLFQDAENLLNQMLDAGVVPDLVTWNSLVSGYSMSGKTNKALSMIDAIKCAGLVPNVVSWTALISGCSQNGRYREAMEFFNQMQRVGVEPNAGTISCLLRTCGGLSMLQQGKEIHCFSIKNSKIKDTYVATAVIDMYNKSGNLRSGHKVFECTRNKSLATWNCMIMGFATYGCGKEAILLFKEMCREGIHPDAVTFTALLSGCKNSSLVSDGWSLFDSMSKDHNITPRIEHYGCMVDLLGRASYVDEAWDFIRTMPFEPDASIWGALLCASRIHKNLYYAEIASKHLFELEPYNCANYVLMVNLYAMLKRWEDAERVKDLMRSRKITNGKVWSWIWVDGKMHCFFSREDEEPHPQAGEIYFELYQLVSEIRKLGYVADTSCVFQRVDNDKEKEKLLLSHTEKMAIAFGLLNKSNSSSPIRVVKSSRVCNDCHNAAKYISLARNRDIFIKDGGRFHHFRDGNCSCNDCW